MRTITEHPTAKTPVLENYDTKNFRKEIALCVSKLAAEGYQPKESETFDRAADEVATRYKTNRGALSWIAHRTDFMKERSVSLQQFFRQAKDSIARPCLPGFELAVKIPQQLLIGDDVVDLGDPRLTLQELIEKVTLVEGMTKKEAEAMKHKAEELEIESDQYRAMREGYVLVAAKAWDLHHVKPADLIFDRETKFWTPRPGA